LIRKLQDTPPPPGNGGGRAPQAPGQSTQAVGGAAITHAAPSGPTAQLAVATQTDALARYATFESVVELIRSHRDVKLLVEVETGLRLHAYQPGRIEFTPSDAAPADLAQRLGARLQAWTGNRWAVTLVNDAAAETIAEKRDATDQAIRTEAQAHPLVQAVLLAFPKGRITSIKSVEEKLSELAAEALPEVDDEWDPFEED